MAANRVLPAQTETAYTRAGARVCVRQPDWREGGGGGELGRDHGGHIAPHRRSKDTGALHTEFIELRAARKRGRRTTLEGKQQRTCPKGSRRTSLHHPARAHDYHRVHSLWGGMQTQVMAAPWTPQRGPTQSAGCTTNEASARRGANKATRGRGGEYAAPHSCKGTGSRANAGTSDRDANTPAPSTVGERQSTSCAPPRPQSRSPAQPAPCAQTPCQELTWLRRAAAALDRA